MPGAVIGVELAHPTLFRCLFSWQEAVVQTYGSAKKETLNALGNRRAALSYAMQKLHELARPVDRWVRCYAFEQTRKFRIPYHQPVIYGVLQCRRSPNNATGQGRPVSRVTILLRLPMPPRKAIRPPSDSLGAAAKKNCQTSLRSLAAIGS